jgi:hypothetical protein
MMTIKDTVVAAQMQAYIDQAIEFTPSNVNLQAVARIILTNEATNAKFFQGVVILQDGRAIENVELHKSPFEKGELLKKDATNPKIWVPKTIAEIGADGYKTTKQNASKRQLEFYGEVRTVQYNENQPMSFTAVIPQGQVTGEAVTWKK